MSDPFPDTRGPFTADHIRPGDPYELSNGHTIRCMGAGGRGSGASAVGAAVLKSDPDVQEAGVDTGYSPKPGTLRAPDIAVGNVPKEPGWVKGVPPLAVEYADTGQDEADLKTKIHELLEAGTRWIWVVRLHGPRRVEIHEPGKSERLAHSGDDLEAPGVLRNPVPVDALYDWEVGSRVTLRNLLQRQGYDDLEAVRAEGQAEGHAQGRAEGEIHTLGKAILSVLKARGLEVDAAKEAEIRECRDLSTLEAWLAKAALVESTEDLL